LPETKDPLFEALEQVPFKMVLERAGGGVFHPNEVE